MKKILVFILCVVLMCAMPIAAFAESDVVEETPPIVETLPVEEATPETEPPDTTPSTELTPLPTPLEPTFEEDARATTEKIKAWFEKNSGVLTIVFTIIGYGVAMFKKIKNVVKAATTMNNNAISITETSKETTAAALAKLNVATSIINSYEEKMKELLDEIRENAEDKKKHAIALEKVTTYLEAAKAANVELSNEVAELLVLANIPNSKKEELYSRHLAAVGAIAGTEKVEVKEDDVEQKA